MKMKRTLVLTAVLVALLSMGLAVPVSGWDPPIPDICLVKSCPDTAAPGETITYHYRLENCGDYDHKGAAQVYDPFIGPGPIWDNELPAGAKVEFDKTYTLPADYCGPFENHAWAIGHPWDPDVGEYLEDVRDDAWCTTEIICPPDTCETELIAGQNSTDGYVEVWDDGTNLYVKYHAPTGWTIDETQLYVGATPPTKAAPGKFPYTGPEATISFIELGLECGDPVAIAAHAVVSMDGQSETAWADTYGSLIRDKGWAMYFGYTLCGECFDPDLYFPWD